MAEKARADKGRHHAARQDVPFEERDDAHKFCPDSLRFVLTAARLGFSVDHSPNRTEFREISRTRRGQKGRLFARTNSAEDILYATEDGTTQFHYFHLEAYARALGLPSSFLLLISRLYSDVSDGKTAEATATLQGMSAGIEALRQLVADGNITTQNGISTAIQAYCASGVDN